MYNTIKHMKTPQSIFFVILSCLVLGISITNAEINTFVPEEIRDSLVSKKEYTEADGYTKWIQLKGDIVEQFFSKTLEKRYFPDGRIEAFNDTGKKIFEKKVNGTEIFYNEEGSVVSVVTDKTLSQFNKGALISREYKSLKKGQDISFRGGYTIIRKGGKEIKIFSDKNNGTIQVETPILFGYIEVKTYIDNQTKSLIIRDKKGRERYVFKDGNVEKNSLKMAFVRFLSKIFSKKVGRSELDALTDSEAAQYEG